MQTFNIATYIHDELLYRIALSLVPNIGSIQAKTLLERLGSAKAIFNATFSQLTGIEGIGEIKANSIRHFKQFDRAAQEISFLEKYQVQPLFFTDNTYPRRLHNCYDSPLLLYYKGNADLNVSRIVSIVGSRHHTEYGKQVTDKLVSDLAAQQVLVVSGLAYGIDAIAHKAALRNNLSTVGVLAHGLDQLYPAQHALLAKDMLKSGGLLTEFRSTTLPDRHNFPIRNRIVAGISDATIVIETGTKGGSMITAEIANSYNKDVFAYPGKVTDTKSQGCNTLIRNNKAVLLTEAKELVELMGWDNSKTTRPPQQKAIFAELTVNERLIVDLLQVNQPMHIDEIVQQSRLSSSAAAAAVLGLELQHLLTALPGKRYKLD